MWFFESSACGVVFQKMRVVISCPKTLVTVMDEAAEKLALSRSAFIRQAVLEKIQYQKEVEGRLNRQVQEA